MIDSDLIFMFVLCFQTYYIEKYPRNLLYHSFFILLNGILGFYLLNLESGMLTLPFFLFGLMFSLINFALHIFAVQNESKNKKNKNIF